MLLEEQDSKSQVVRDLTAVLGFDQELKKVYSGRQNLISLKSYLSYTH